MIVKEGDWVCLKEHVSQHWSPGPYIVFKNKVNKLAVKFKYKNQSAGSEYDHIGDPKVANTYFIFASPSIETWYE